MYTYKKIQARGDNTLLRSHMDLDYTDSELQNSLLSD